MSQQEMTQKYMRSIELDKILRMVAQRASCEDSRNLAEAMIPAAELDRAQQLLTETDDAYILMARFGSPSYSGLASCRGRWCVKSHRIAAGSFCFVSIEECGKVALQKRRNENQLGPTI